MKQKTDSRHEVTVRLTDAEMQRFRACIASKQLKTNKRITHQDVLAELLAEWMEAIENEHGTLVVRPPVSAKRKGG